MAAPQTGSSSEQPSLARMKAFILEHQDLAAHPPVASAIMHVVAMEVGLEALRPAPRGQTDIDFDAVGESHPAVVQLVFNILAARVATLSRPAGRD